MCLRIYNWGQVVKISLNFVGDPLMNKIHRLFATNFSASVKLRQSDRLDEPSDGLHNY